MKLEDIKKMSDEEFIEYVKGIMDINYYTNSLNGSINEINKYKLQKSLEFGIKNDNGKIASLSSLVLYAIIFVMTDTHMPTEHLILSLFGTGAVSYSIGYLLGKKEIKSINLKKKQNLEQNIIKLKSMLENLTEEELKILIENISFYKEYKVSDELIKRSDVLLVANRLIELNATNILEEFELSNDNNSRVNYCDDEKVIDSVKTIKNN